MSAHLAIWMPVGERDYLIFTYNLVKSFWKNLVEVSVNENFYANDVYQFAETLQTNCTSKRDFSTPTHHFQSELFCVPGRFASAFPHRNS